MRLESTNRIQNIINSIDRKLGFKTVNLASAVKVLCGGFSATKGTAYKAQTSNHPVASCKRIFEILDGANKTTGYNDPTITSAVQRLCDGYSEQTPLYSFGALSDLHIQYNTGLADFQRALTYLKERVPFTCVCGDLVSFADAANMAQYKSYVDTYAGEMRIYECAGNHETFPSLGVGGALDEALWLECTGKEPNYSFQYENDVFIFLSINRHANSGLFKDGALAWLESTLETNKNKRCFVFQHFPEATDDCADPSNSYDATLMGANGQAFVSLIKRYRNTIWFHGHTHVTFGAEQYPVSEAMGYRSVHIPSLSSLRFYDVETDSLLDYYYDTNGNKIWGSLLAEGYIVDVYEKKIVLRSINFAAGDNKDQVEAISDEVYVFDTTSTDNEPIE